jgi:hypothetical protein
MAVEYKITAPLENQFHDTIGEPVIGGYVYFYKATDHNTKKNIAKIESPSIPGDYYDNPVELDSSGGIPVPYLMYFADDEYYYVVLTTADQNPLLPPVVGNIIRTWDNFGVVEGSAPSANEIDYTNYILNSQYRFYRYASRATADLVASNDNYIADSGWFFKRTNISSNVTISFKEFVAGQTDVPNNPIYYLNYSCVSVGVGETEKDILFKIDDVRALSGKKIQLAFYAKSITLSACEIVIKQHFGSGGSADAPALNVVQLKASWTQHTLSTTIPSVSGKTIGDGNYLSIAIRAPLNAASIANFDLTQWQLNRGDTSLEYNYKTKEIEQATERTYVLPYPTDDELYLALRWTGEKYEFDGEEVGGVSISFGASKAGYFLADGGSYSTLDYADPNNKVKLRRLYDAWNNSVTGIEGSQFTKDGNAFGYGDDGFKPVTSYSSSAIFINTRVITSIPPWTDNNTGYTFTALQLGGDKGFRIKSSGDFDIAANDMVAAPTNNEIQVSNLAVGAVTDATAGTAGAYVQTVVTQQGSASVEEQTRVAFVNINAAIAGLYITINTPSVAYYMWFRVDGVGVDPAIGGKTGIVVDIPLAATKQIVANLAADALHGCSSTLIDTHGAPSLSGGEYFNIYNSANHYTPYMIVDGAGDAPSVGGAINVPINVSFSDTSPQVRDKIVQEIKAIIFQVPDMRGWGIRGADNGAQKDPGRDGRYMRGSEAYGDMVGTKQRDETRSHRHQIEFDTGGAAVTRLATASSAASGYLDAASYVGGAESRMMNVSVNFFIKY